MCRVNAVLDQWTCRCKYLVNVATEVQEQRLGELAAVDGIVLTEVFARDRGCVDVQSHLPVVSARFEDIAAKRDKVVQRRQHLYKSS